MDKYRRGRFGEEKAVEYLIENEYEIVSLNYSTRYGEIDIIATVDNYLCFIEVKTRIGTPFGTAAEAVTASKRAKIINTANLFISGLQTIELQPRFDIIEVVSDKNKGDSTLWRVNHIINAFGVDEV